MPNVLGNRLIVNQRLIKGGDRGLWLSDNKSWMFVSVQENYPVGDALGRISEAADAIAAGHGIAGHGFVG